MIRVVLLGGGKLATHLATKLFNSDAIELVQIYNRTLNKIVKFTSITTITDSFKEIKNADVYIIATSDSSIEEVSEKLKKHKGIVVHTSGAIPLNSLTNEQSGVFYPLQSFSENKEIDFLKIPICIESKNIEDYSKLESLAKAISNNVYSMSSEQRRKLHVAAVFVNNFVNYMYTIGADICKENEIPFEVLQPLIMETAEKLKELTPEQAQTGPAIRKDKKTLALHEKELNKDQIKIYKLLSSALLNKK